MKYRRRKIVVKYFTPFSRRVVIFDEKENVPYLKDTALSKNQYAAYRKSLLKVSETVERIQLKGKVQLVIRPWGLFFWESFLRGGYKSPTVLVNRDLVSSGEIPSEEKIIEAVYKEEARHRFLEGDE